MIGVESASGVITLRAIEVAIRDVQRGSDKTAAELAIVRLEAELIEMMRRRDEAVKRSGLSEHLLATLRQRWRDKPPGDPGPFWTARWSWALGGVTLAFAALSLTAVDSDPSRPTSTLTRLAAGFLCPVVVVVAFRAATWKAAPQTALAISQIDELDSAIAVIRERIARNRAIADA